MNMDVKEQISNPQGYLDFVSRHTHNQEVTEHNIDTRQKSNVFCLEPVTIVNPQLVDFVLTRSNVYYIDNGVFFKFNLPKYNIKYDTQGYKKLLSTRIAKLVKRSHIHTFFDEDGVCMDAYLDVPCGHCLLCIERKRNSFAARCAMECQQHEMLPLFITLTYDDQHLPKDGVTTRDVQLFLKRIRIDLKRNHNFNGELRFAAGSEYGSKTQRPHYHMLLWNFPRTGEFRHAGNVHGYLAQHWQNGIVDLKFCKNTKAGLYIGKYMSKDDAAAIPDNLNPTRHWTSKNLGVQFVLDTAYSTLQDHADNVELKYRDRFDGSLKSLPLIKYYINKIFPTYTSIPVECRNAIRDIQLSRGLIEYSDEVKKLDSVGYAFDYLVDDDMQYDFYDEFAYANTRKYLEKYISLPKHDYINNQTKRDMFYNTLITNFGDVDLHHKAYVIEKRNAVARDKEIF